MDESRILPPRILDTLYAQGVSSEHARVLEQQEAKALAGAVRPPDTELCRVRGPTMRFISRLAGAAQLSAAGRFAAVQLLDMYHSRGGGGDEPVAFLPAACASAVALVGKGEDSSFGLTPEILATEASQFAQWLQMQGLQGCCQDVAHEDVLRAEWQMLELLEWQLQQPSVHTWLSVQCERFNVLSDNKYRGSLDFVQQRGLMTTWTLLARKNGAHMEITPRQVACGLFCLGAAAARLLPMEALRPPHVSPQDWAVLFHQSQGQAGLPCALALQLQMQVLAWLQLAASCKLHELQELAYAVAVAMKAAVEEMQEKQRAGALPRRGKENCSANVGGQSTCSAPLGDGSKRCNRTQPESEPEVAAR